MNLKHEIDEASRHVNTGSITMSFGEVMNMYSEGELNINPEFQRLFRWSPEKKSRFIESLLMNIPVPSIFVFENTDGTWELIDGLQRLSTVLEFAGRLRDPETRDPLPPSVLSSTKYLPSLENAVWEYSESITDVPIDQQVPIDIAHQRAIRTSRLQVEILKRPSDTDTKYDLFQRLNRGGETANAQEVRNCLCVMLSRNYFGVFNELKMNADFVNVVRLTEDAVMRQRDIEYVMRFVVHTFVDYDAKRDVENFIDDGIKYVIENVNQRDVRTIFADTFDWLNRAHGDVALLPSLGQGGRGNRVTLRQVEAIAVGIARNHDAINHTGAPVDFVRDRVAEFWNQDEDVRNMSAPGLRGTQRLQRTVPFGINWFRP